MAGKIKILEVGLRDGIQNENVHFTVSDRFYILKKLISAGLQHIEVGSFVSPKVMPSMGLTPSLMKKINRSLTISKNVELSALVPNERGFDMAFDHGLKSMAVMTSATESFSKKNINCSIEESLERIKLICKKARRFRVRIRGYLSMAFVCPYEGVVSVRKVLNIAEKMKSAGVKEIALSDTVGGATPLQVSSMIEKISKKIPLSHISLHCHNTRGMALPNILTALNAGVQSFDSSIGGLGGCPYAPGSAGNVATEDLVVLLQGMKQKNSIDLKKLTQISHWLKTKKKVCLSSYMSRY
ncbi:MAG: hydroxymethylglutaryl-CoA lyase [Bdellovibrionales bacterium]|nr:hydroxymethylglutaryl-CoA lyase [Bdellovibrionales bacterium]